MACTRAKIVDLIDGNIDSETHHQMLATPKDPERFTVYLDILQERMSWQGKIVLPLGSNLYIVQAKTSKQWLVRCECGHDFCGWNENWKLSAHRYPVIRDFEPDVDTFYQDLLGLRAPERVDA